MVTVIPWDFSFDASNAGYYPPGYNCTAKPYLVVSTKNVSLGGKTARIVEAIIVS